MFGFGKNMDRDDVYRAISEEVDVKFKHLPKETIKKLIVETFKNILYKPSHWNSNNQKEHNELHDLITRFIKERLAEEIKETIHGEEFIDKIVERINKKRIKL